MPPRSKGQLNRRQSFGVIALALTSPGCSRPDQPVSGPSVGQTLSDPTARRFYEQRGWRQAWTPSLAQSLQDAIAGARAHGLAPSAFQPKGADESGPPLADENLTISALAYAKALALGALDPHRIESIFTLERNSVDLGVGLEVALQRGDIASWFASLAPADPEYQALSAAYVSALGQSGLPAAPPRGAPIGSSMAPADQARQLAANLERRRWLSRPPPGHRIDVNTAVALFSYLSPGAPSLAGRAVVGRQDHPTPSIQAAFHRLIANPPWRVPRDIAEKEILPKGRGYLARERMRFVGGQLEQAPGPKSALGRVKFDVEDPYDIYLHDTPAKALFAAPDRHRSHGCVRVQHAVALARGIAAETGRADAFDRALASADTREVELGQSIPVRMLYHTAHLDPDGRVLLAPDVYGADDRLAAALGFGQAVAASQQEPEVLLGP
jgi:murein L,D-transpeptidase YcbB/YkuD